ncbi:TPA: conjugal transfer protein TraL [Legionella anisa]
MAKIHVVLQGKGGVGKSFVASTLAQYKKNKGEQPLCIDTDPVNTTFAGYQALDVTRLQIMDGDEINSRRFDDLIELIAPETNDVIIDNGASSFVPLSHYLISSNIPSLLADMGHELVVHTVITGGQALQDTVHGFSQLVSQFPENTSFVVWLNSYWGPVQHDGKDFEQMKTYKENKERITAIIRIPALKEETFGRDLTEMLQERLTFSEAITSSDKTIMTRQRLKIVRDELFNQLTNAVVT